MSTAKTKKTQNTTAGAFDAAVDQFSTVADMVQGGFDAALDAGADQARAACAFEGVEFAGREHVDAAMKASEAYFAGIKELNALWFKTAKDTARLNVEASKTLTACKTPEDFSEAHQKLASGGYEAAMAVANTFTETLTKVSSEVSAPLKDQFGAGFTPFWTQKSAA